MIIAGLQKLTLLDYPGRLACTVFTPGCNFRCPFCHNAPLVLPGQTGTDITEEEVLSFLKKRVGILEGVAVTGGEPLMHRDIPAFLEKVKALGYSVKLDTNGSFPGLLKALVRDGLVDRVAMDIKNAPGLYGRTVGLEGFGIRNVDESRSFLLEGTVDYEFRTTVVRGIHTRESLVEAAEWIRGAKEYYLQQFKDSGNVIAIEGLGSFDGDEMNALCAAVREFVPAAQVRGV